jgi:hypothetical protein
MPFRARTPETKRIPLSNDNWILVKKHLTTGEYRAMLKGYLSEDRSNTLEPTRVGLSKILTYLLDWSVDDSTLAIFDKPDDVRVAALNAIDPEDFGEILKAVETHMDEMQEVRALEKKVNAAPSLPT